MPIRTEEIIHHAQEGFAVEAPPIKALLLCILVIREALVGNLKEELFGMKSMAQCPIGDARLYKGAIHLRKVAEGLRGLYQVQIRGRHCGAHIKLEFQGAGACGLAHVNRTRDDAFLGIYQEHGRGALKQGAQRQRVNAAVGPRRRAPPIDGLERDICEDSRR